MAENTWYDGTPGMWGYGAIADMGPYVGPWPLMAPGVLTDANGDVLFWLALPNPADPSDPTIVSDGSYDTDVFAAERTDLTSTGDAYFSRNEFTFSPGTVFVAGMHLYLLIRWDVPDIGDPIHPPGFYVPNEYSSYGTAASKTVPGGWTAPQDGPVVQHCAIPGVWGGFSDPAFFAFGFASLSSSTPWPTWYPPDMPTWDDVEAAAMPTSMPLNTGVIHTLWTAQAGESGVLVDGAFAGSRAEQVGYGEVVYPYFTRIDKDPVGADLVFGVDYGPNPNPDVFYDQIEYIAGGEITPEWIDCGNPMQTAQGTAVDGGVWDAGHNGLQPGETYTDGPFASFGVDLMLRLWEPANPDLPGGDPGFETYFSTGTPTAPTTAAADPITGALLPAAGWSLLLTRDTPISADFNTGTFAADGGSASGGAVADFEVLPSTLPMAAGIPEGTREIVLLIGSHWATGITSPGDVPTFEANPLAEDPHPIGGPVSGGQVVVNAEYDLTQWPTDSIGGDDGSQLHPYLVGGFYQGPPYLAHNPAWHYWQPNRIVPAGIFWHNAYGHYTPAGSVALQINTPGIGWVDIVDGPA